MSKKCVFLKIGRNFLYFIKRPISLKKLGQANLFIYFLFLPILGCRSPGRASEFFFEKLD